MYFPAQLGKLTAISQAIGFSLVIFYLLLFSVPVTGQSTLDFNNYSPLTASGPLPDVFKQYAIQKVQSQLIPTTEDSDIKEKVIEKKVEEYELKTTTSYNALLSSGRLLFGDPITKYIDKVKNVVFKDHPDLKDKLTFYTYKSSSFNAFCLPNGTICVEIGLLANLNSEAELAFILAHEAAHYVKQHGFNSYIESYKVSKGKGDYAKMSYEETIDLRYTFSKNDELEADSFAFELFAKTDYHRDALEKVFEVMNYSYLPYEEVPFDKTFFNIDNLVIPQSYFKDDLSPILPVRDYNERWDTHPNTVTRMHQIEEVLDGQSKGEKLFLVSESEFQHIRKLARFECIRLDLMRREYGSAIYLSYLMMKEYPNNEYLETSVAKALYGLAKYKNADEFHRAARPYLKAEGESQQIHYLLRKLDRKQLSTLAIKHISKVHDKYPDHKNLLQLKTDLFKDLVVTCELTPKDYTRLGDEASDNDRLFYKQAFQHELEKDAFKEEFSAHYPDLKEKKRKEELPYKLSVKEKKEEKKKLEKEGLDLDATKVLVVDPIFAVIGKEGYDHALSISKKRVLEDAIRQAAKEHGLKTEFLNFTSLAKGGTTAYNTISRFVEWVQEKEAHGKIELLSILADDVEDLSALYGTNLVYFPTIVYVRSNKTSYITMYVFNLNSGKIAHINETDRIGMIPPYAVKELIEKDFNLIVH